MIMMQLIMSRNRERGQTCLRGDSFEYAVCTQGCRVLRIHANYWRREIAWRRRWKMAREENSCRVSPVTICKIVSRYSARRSLGRRSANDNRPTYALRCFPSLRSPSRRPRCAKNNGTNEHRLADLPANARQPPSTQQIYLIPWIFVCNRSR